MTRAATALQRLFGGFGLPAWAENDVPDSARMPYITYEAAAPPPLGRVTLRARVWYPGGARFAVSAKLDEIESALSDGGAWVEGVLFDLVGTQVRQAGDVCEGVAEVGARAGH